MRRLCNQRFTQLWRASVFALTAAATLWAGAAGAGEVRTTSTTLFWVHPEWRSGTAVNEPSLIQRLGVSGQGYGGGFVQDLAFDALAWGEVQIPANSQVGDADLETANVQARVLKRHLKLTVGRQWLSGGAARFLHFDGGRADLDIAGGLGVTAYGGLNVIPRFMEGRGDAVVGGRLYWRRSWENELGISVIQLLDRGLVARRDAGLDGRWALTRKLWLNASGILSLVEMRLADAQLAAHWEVHPRWQVSADVRRVAPDLYLPRSSIFSVFAEQERDSVGAIVSFSATDRLQLTGDYHLLHFEQGSGDYGHDATLRADHVFSSATRVGSQLRFVYADIAGYTQFRAFGKHSLTPALALTVDVDATWLAQPVNGVSRALMGGASVTYALGGGWSAHASGLIATTPYFAGRYELLGRLVYDFSKPGAASP